MSGVDASEETPDEAAAGDGAEPGEGTPAEATLAGPRIEIVGGASAEQVAALVAVLSGVGGREDETPAPASRWASRVRLTGARPHPGPDGWRASAFPR